MWKLQFWEFNLRREQLMEKLCIIYLKILEEESNGLVQLEKLWATLAGFSQEKYFLEKKNIFRWKREIFLKYLGRIGTECSAHWMHLSSIILVWAATHWEIQNWYKTTLSALGFSSFRSFLVGAATHLEIQNWYKTTLSALGFWFFFWGFWFLVWATTHWEIQNWYKLLC